MDITAVVSASAAILAAALAALNLYVTGRREEAHWARDALLETLEKYLSASFDMTRAATVLGREVDPSVDMNEFEARISSAHRDQMQMLTRLRLLADETTIRSASDLHGSDREYVKFMRGLDHKVTPQELTQAQNSAHARRYSFVIASRQMMKVRGRAARVENV